MTTEQQEKKSKPTCYTCHAEVIFDKNKLSPRGIQIPLDPETKEPHKCKTTEQKEDEQSKQTELSRQNEEKLKKNGTATTTATAAPTPTPAAGTASVSEPRQVTPFTTSLIQIISNLDPRVVESRHKDYMQKIRSWGAIIKGVTYQMAFNSQNGLMHSIAITFEIPTNAVDKIKNET